MRNIMTPRQEHARYCWQPDGGWLGDMKDVYAWEGDVRQCVHGRIMIGYNVPGSGSVRWRDLSRVLHPLLYSRALKVLASPDYRLARTTDFEFPKMSLGKEDE